MSESDYISNEFSIWTTRDGTKIEVNDMTTQHIKNTLKCIEDGRINFLINCGWANDNDYIEYDEDTYKKETWIKTFKNELKRRTSNDI